MLSEVGFQFYGIDIPSSPVAAVNGNRARKVPYRIWIGFPSRITIIAYRTDLFFWAGHPAVVTAFLDSLNQPP